MKLLKMLKHGILENEKNINGRNSNIDLLKIIAMFLIVLAHSVPWWKVGTSTGLINIFNATSDINEFLVILISCLGQVGNCIFIISSSYFLIDNDKVKAKKVLLIVIDTFIVSVMIMLFFIASGHQLSFKEILKCILPITFDNNWFIGCYILYYIIHPVLNKFINSINKKQLLVVNIFLIIYFYIWQFMKQTVYTNVMGFIVIYFLVAYVKKYMKEFSKKIKINSLMLIIAIIAQIILLTIFNFLGLKYSIFSDKMRYTINIINPFIVIASLSIFNIVNSKKITNKIFANIASLSLLIYIIHENILIKNYTRSEYFENIYTTIGYNYIVPIVFCTGIVVFIVCIFISIIYKNTIQKISQKVSDIIYEKGSLFFNKIIDVLAKIN